MKASQSMTGMQRIGVVSPEQMHAMWQDYLTRQQLSPQLRYNYPQRRPVEEVSPHRVFVKNTGTEAIPAFACMRIIGVEDIGGRTCIKVEKPTSTDGEFLFNCCYPIDAAAAATESTPAKLGVGWAYRHGVVTMLGDEPTEPGAVYGPIVGSWEIQEGGDKFVVFGREDLSERALVGRYAGGGGGGSEWINFTVVDVVCPNDADNDDPENRLYVWATVDAYSNSCTTAPTLFDTYSGMIKVFDGCVMSYFTADSTEGSGIIGKKGTAVLMRPFRKYTCTPWWECKAICGEPTCGPSEEGA